MNKAIHIFFTQAVPLTTYVDDSCLYLQNKQCTACQAVCQNGAIDFTQTDKKMDINVGAIILAPGFDTFDPILRNDYGYGKYENVVTSMDFERILSATGPYEGEVLRASDKKHAHKIAWIQCVGSRQVNPEGANSFCSSVCCSYAQKQVILTKEHEPDAECVVFHNDIRSHNKDLDRYFQRADGLSDVRFIRSYVSIGREIPETKNVTIRYSTAEEGVIEEEFDLVVLSVGLNPPKSNQVLANTFGIELEEHGFAKLNPANPIETNRAGVFISGAFQGPSDIPESVYTASAAGAQCGELLDYRRGKLTAERVYPPEKDVADEEPKVGVFVCHCGANISRIVDVPSTVEYAASLPNVVHAQEQLFSCATNSAKEIADMAKEKGFNRLVISACSPRTLEPLFKDTMREAGLNQYYFDMANIREHCSWVHPKEKEAATQKAKDLVRMSVARARTLQPLQEYNLNVDKRCLVVGGGIAGMNSALSVANQGHEVYLLEKDSDLGGMANKIYHTLDGMDVQAYLKELKAKVYKHPAIHVYTDAKIKGTSGYIGNFVTKVEMPGRKMEIKHGAAILATGADVYQPTEYRYGEDERVMTHLELEEQIFNKDEKLQNARSLAMIQCVGCRNAERDYCSRVCCNESIKNALSLKELNPEMDIYIFFKDMRTYGFAEDYYREAASKGVRFIRFDDDNQPKVEEGVDDENRPVLKISAVDPVLRNNFEVDAEYLALAAAVVPSESSTEAGTQFKITFMQDGFFKEAHVKLRPVEFAVDGVYLCGMAHYPKQISESINQAYGAAGRVLTLLSHDSVTASGSVAEVKETYCVSCGACITACNYDAIQFIMTPLGRKASVNPAICKGDGLCNTKCPTSAIQLKHFTDEQMFSQIDAAAGL